MQLLTRDLYEKKLQLNMYVVDKEKFMDFNVKFKSWINWQKDFS